MIKFFRRIRQRLLTENKTSKYLLYAIGEIFLVVVGILIALQINNWNENRKLKGSEIKLLQNFKSSIEADTVRVNRYIKIFSGVEKDINSILHHMEADLPYHDSLPFINATAIWWPKIDQEIFATLTSSDLNNISNDSLKKEITSYYSWGNGGFDIAVKRYADYVEDAVKNVYVSRFNAFGITPGEENTRMHPIDYEALKKDQEFLYSIKTQKNYFFWYVKRPLNQAKERADNLLGSLNKELKQFDQK
jgi:hypothetical protein